MTPASRANPPGRIELRTPRLRLIGADPALARLMGRGGDQLAAALGATVPPDWPPELARDGAFDRMAIALELLPPRTPWTSYAIIDHAAGRMIGMAGFKGPPETGRVDIGYAILDAYQNRGFATEASRALIGLAFSEPSTERIVGETLDGLDASIRVMVKCGMRSAGRGVGHEGEPDVIRYELSRSDYQSLRQLSSP